jgi:uncharacterized protein (TIGR02453 family)
VPLQEGFDMTTGIDLRPVLKFVTALKRNNNREWFQAHRADFEVARAHFEDYVAALIAELSRTEPLAGLSPKDCIFRLNRDLRFTKDKTPYKPYMSAYIAPGGRKSRRMGYYVHLEPGNAMLAGGLHEPEPQQLAAWRATIARDPRPFRKIAGSEVFRKTFGEVRGERLKTVPRGYPRDHPEAELLRLKSVTVVHEVSEAQVLSPGFLRETLATFKAMKPFLRYLEVLG